MTRYFLLQAALIPIHCLRRNPSHVDAGSWRAQIQTALDIINGMTNLNPSAPKCRDIICRLCGDTFVGPDSAPGPSHMRHFSKGPAPTATQPSWNGQEQQYNNLRSDDRLPESASGTVSSTDYDSWPTMFPTAGFANPAFPYSTAAPTEGVDADAATGNRSDSATMDPWMTEVDTAIDNYNVYCDRLSNAAMAGMGLGPQFGELAGDRPVVGDETLNLDGTEIGTGVQDWDWGLML
ncbi:hypothetical protein A1O1_07775 [Capronia coronata CBS 617.96]|uniref:Uncharacterized protein n=1 Tax=Capronia coronata CBS 617.96 TaxID=1182541 RepID=W9XWG8_9EURO|nr:uncharacterized protein A1O1_07775 [Capronia coronata CBS 617.96]EXJ81710.1 hypothetical protein A1O1_07775 [Capronia coronata CBS 617.96]